MVMGLELSVSRMTNDESLLNVTLSVVLGFEGGLRGVRVWRMLQAVRLKMQAVLLWFQSTRVARSGVISALVKLIWKGKLFWNEPVDLILINLVIFNAESTVR